MIDFTDQECLAILGQHPRDEQEAERAVAALFQRYDRRLQVHLRWRYPTLGSEDLAEVSQDTWLRAWRHLDENIRPEAFRSWLFRIGTNLAIDLIRRKATRSESGLGEREFVTGEPDHTHALAYREQLQRCVERLPPDLRDLMSRLLNLETHDEIAAATGRKKSRIYQIKHEVGKLLLSCMEQRS